MNGEIAMSFAGVLHMWPRVPVVLFAWLLSAADLSGGERMSPELLWKLGRVGGGVISPDGRQVAYTVRRFQVDENKGRTDIWIAPLAGGPGRCLLDGLPDASDVQWGRSPKGPRLFFISKREDEEDRKPQAWSLDPDSGELTQVTDVEEGIGHLKVSPQGGRIAFTVRIKLDSDVVDLYPDLPKAKAKIIDSLMFRHWNKWRDGTYSHLHVAKLSSEAQAEESVDLMEGLRFDCPVPPFAGSEHFAWSPDGGEIAFTAKMVNKPEASTDTDIYLAASRGEGRNRCITPGMDGYDMDPSYSPDGRFIAFHSMERAGFEADRNRIMLFDRERRAMSELTAGLDQTTHGATWSPDSKSVYFYSEWRGTNQVFRLDLESAELVQLTRGRYNWSLRGVSPDGKNLLVARQSMLRPYELARLSATGGEVALITDVNGPIYEDLELPSVEERTVRSTDGREVHNWVIYPPDFERTKRWPMLTYCQGGPQGQIGQWFSYRWNFHLMAARGYVVLAVNRRGLPGFGRSWNDQISGDWGGQAMRDILAATDSMMSEPYIDNARIAAIGASYGGYTTYWLMGNHEGRFCAMISHCGVFNLESMYGSTEELFFVNWDLGGPYWRDENTRRDYDRFSPHRFVRNWTTPLLVIHGEKDFRVPVTQGIEAFTAAQVRGVPSRFLYFPEEGHWVLGPQNGILWHRLFFEWLDRWCRVERPAK